MTSALAKPIQRLRHQRSQRLRNRLLVRSVMLVVVASLLAALANSLSPRRIPWYENWDKGVEARAWGAGFQVSNIYQVTELARQGAAILDARPIADYDKGHLPQALPMPLSDAAKSLQELQPILKKEGSILVYCRGRDCDEALMLCQFLQKQGYRQLHLFAGGWEAWKSANQLTEGETP